MTVLYLVRHGLTDAVGRRLSGRLPGISLNERGREQAARLARLFGSLNPVAVYSSPLERAVETALAIAAPHRLPVHQLPGLTDIDFGSWTNAELDALVNDPEFNHFNRQRTFGKPPGGESTWAIEARMAEELFRVLAAHQNSTVVVVGHADPIRLALCHLLGFPVDLSQRLDIRPGAVSRIEVGHECTLSLFDYVPGEFEDCGGDPEAPPQ